MEQDVSKVSHPTIVSLKEEFKKNPRPDGLFSIDAGSLLDFYKKYYLFLRPIVNLTDKEIDVMSSFMKQRWQLSREIPGLDSSKLDILVMSDKVKSEVIKDANLSKKHFYVVMSALKKKGIIKNNIIEPKLIPNVSIDNRGIFKLMLVFKGNWQ